MPYADPDKQREYMRTLMRKRRAEKRQAKKVILKGDEDGKEKQT
jgi:hypothetical protein